MHVLKSLHLYLGLLSMIACRSTSYQTTHTPITYVINNDIQEDSNIVNSYNPYKQKLDQEMNRQIGYSEQFLNRSRTVPEFLAGNLFADALLATGKELDADVQISFATKGGIRADLRQGSITVGSIYEIMPFENMVTILELSGKDMQALLQFIAKTNGQPVSGLRMKIKNQEPVAVEIAGTPFDPSKSYKIVTYDYLANGGDYIEGLVSPIQRIDTQIKVRDGLIEYIEKETKQGKHINTKLDGRISHAE